MAKILLIVFLLIGCQSKKEALISNNIIQKKEAKSCPNDGVCTIEVLKNKSVHLRYDEFDLPYVDFSESKSTLLKYSYKRNVEETLADAYYEEIVYIEIKDINEDYVLKDVELTQVNAIFGRLCFCRGATGYYKISEGQLNLNRKSQNLNFTFKINEVPQVINAIDETFEL